MDSKRILVIEDEKQIARFVELELQHEGYEVIKEFDGLQGLNAARYCEPDLVLLDIMLPKINGIEVCRRIREFSAVPVIMLTARDETIDKVTGLDIGANDYITKPFEMDELLARIRAVFRNNNLQKPREQSLKINNLSMDLISHTVLRDKQSLTLTKKEFDLLEMLIKNRGILLTREQILEQVWGIDYEGDANVVDVYIRYLRSKLDDNFKPKLIHTVRGFGYLMEDKELND